MEQDQHGGEPTPPLTKCPITEHCTFYPRCEDGCLRRTIAKRQERWEHTPGCWQMGPEHYSCALQRIRGLQDSIERAHEKTAVTERALRDCLTKSMRSAPAYKWREVIIDALIISHIYTREHENDPRKALADLLAWETSVALDPLVSEEARNLLNAQPPEQVAYDSDNPTLGL